MINVKMLEVVDSHDSWGEEEQKARLRVTIDDTDINVVVYASLRDFGNLLSGQLITLSTHDGY